MGRNSTGFNDFNTGAFTLHNLLKQILDKTWLVYYCGFTGDAQNLHFVNHTHVFFVEIMLQQSTMKTLMTPSAKCRDASVIPTFCLCDFHTQHPCCVGSKAACTISTPMGVFVLKIRCGQTLCWHIILLRWEKAIVPFTVKQLEHCVFYCVKWRIVHVGDTANMWKVLWSDETKI